MFIKEINIPLKNVNKKTICHFSDLHLATFDEFSSDEEKQRAIESNEYWIDKRVFFAEKYNEPYPDKSKDLFTLADELLELANKSDIAVMTGDIMDYVSDANIRFFEEKCSKLKVPFMAVRGNHEKELCLSENSILNAMQKPVSVVDLGDIQIMGIDNSNRTISKNQLSGIKSILGKKPTVIAMHIPIMTKQNRDILIGCDEYFRMNEYPGCPPESEEFIKLICKPESQVAAVLTGHLHFGNISEIDNGIFQYGVSQGLTGNAYLLNIGQE